MPDVTLLPVPAVSQSGKGADRFRNDCGAACVAMLIQAYTSQPVTPDEIFARITTQDRYLLASEMMLALSRASISTQWWAGLNLGNLFTYLVERKPAIALIKYGVLRDAGLASSSFEGPHWVTVIGMDTATVAINDPLSTGARPVFIPINTFLDAWTMVGRDPSVRNPERAAIVPTRQVGDPTQPVPQPASKSMKVTAWRLNVRQGPGISYPVVSVLEQGKIVQVVEEKAGWGRLGEGRWSSLAYLMAC